MPILSEVIPLQEALPKSLLESQGRYVKSKLSSEMSLQKGRKRLRKKKAERALEMRWRFLQFANVLRPSRGYAAVGRKAFSVEPLPVGALPIYDKDPDVTKVVTGNSEEGGE